MIRISAPHFVAGVVLGDRAAPIVGYMAHWSRERVLSYCRAKRWTCEVMP